MQSPEELLKQLDDEEKESVTAFKSDFPLPRIGRLSIDVKGSWGKRYQGEFIFKVPNLGDQMRIGQLKSLYLPNGAAADPNALLLAEQISYLGVTLQDPKPAWWDPINMVDATPLGAVYTEALIYERKFHGADENRADDAGAARTTELDQDGGSESARETIVGRKVQPAAERRTATVPHTERSSGTSL